MEIRSGEMPLKMRNVSLHKEPGQAGRSPSGHSGNPVSSQPDCLQPQQHSLGSCFWGNCLLRFYGWTETGNNKISRLVEKTKLSTLMDFIIISISNCIYSVLGEYQLTEPHLRCV